MVRGTSQGRGQRWLAVGIFIKAILAVLFATVFQVVGYLVTIALGLADESVLALAIVEGCSLAGAVLGICALGGSRMLTTSREDMRETFRLGWGCLAVACAFVVVGAAMSLAEGEGMAEGWPSLVAMGALGCLFIGLFEEVMFRGVILGSLLALMGRTHRGTVWAIVLTSVLFGCAHVDFTVIDPHDPLLVGQGVLKAVQTAMFSLLLCTCVLRTRRLGAVSLLHALDDFILVAASLVFSGDGVSADYVNVGAEGVETLVLYVVTVVLYLPFTVGALRELRHGRYAWRGAFFDRAMERRANGAGLPVPPRVTTGDLDADAA